MRVTMHGRACAACALAISLAGLTGAAAADELTTTASTSTFNSPGNLYGPWQSQSMRLQWQFGPNDIPSITLVHRVDGDRTPLTTDPRTGAVTSTRDATTRSTALYLDDYHTWNDTFYTYAQLETSSGNVLPWRGAYAEGDWKFGRRENLVLAAGAGFYGNSDGSLTRELSAGPTLYVGPMAYTARYLASNVSGTFTAPGVTTSERAYGTAVQLVAQYTTLGRDQATISFLGGRQPGVVTGNLTTLPPTLTNVQSISQLDVLLKHWVRPSFGFELGATFGAHNYVSPPNGIGQSSIYNMSGLTFGVFFGRAIGMPKS